MARCRTLFQENQELGKQVSQGKVAQLEAEIAVQKEVNEELKNSQDGKTPPQVSSVSLEELKATALCTTFIGPNAGRKGQNRGVRRGV